LAGHALAARQRDGGDDGHGHADVMTAERSFPSQVTIIGGGLAGMAAAVALESAGANVTLIEARRTLGGRAGSFQDPQTGEMLDNCQHVLLGCCTNLIDFYRRMGVLSKIRFHDAIHFRDEAGRRYDLRGTPGLPAPLHLGTALARFGLLSITERVALTRAMIAMMRLGPEGRDRLADLPFGEWFDQQRQPASLVERLYDPIIVSALNEQTRRSSAKYAIHVFQDSLLANASGYAIGMPTCSLGELYARLPCRDVRLGTRAASLRFATERVVGVELHNGQVLQADAVVIATNFHSVRRWIPEALAQRDERFARLEALESVPILGAHLWFDRPVMRESHAALVGGPLQWVFRKDESGSSVHGVISAAREWVDRAKDVMLREFEAQVRRVLPTASGARLVRGVVVIEKRATFAPVPGSDAGRAAQAPPLNGGVRNLFLAGDYTRTGWPATMEGAVRSGYLAAEAVVGGARRFLVADLPLQWPLRLLSGL
jgi:zeta-carotene desaturase